MSNKADITDEPGSTFREKSLWITLVATLGLYGYYFSRVLADRTGAAALFVGVTIALIAVQIVAHAALAIRHRPERLDERDRAIAHAATRNGYYVLMTGVWGALGAAACSLGAFWIAQAALAAVVLGESTTWATELFYYRRGLA